MIKLIQGAIAPYYQETIKQDLEYFKDRWVKTNYTSNNIVQDPNIIDNGQEIILLFSSQEPVLEIPENNLFFFLKPIILTAYDKPIKSLLKVKVNRLLRDENFTLDNYNIPHQDVPESNYMSMIYYINDSDGDTVFFEDNTIVKRISPSQGDIVLFDSNLWHASSNPSINAERIVLNVVAEM